MRRCARASPRPEGIGVDFPASFAETISPRVSTPPGSPSQYPGGMKLGYDQASGDCAGASPASVCSPLRRTQQSPRPKLLAPASVPRSSTSAAPVQRRLRGEGGISGARLGPTPPPLAARATKLGKAPALTSPNGDRVLRNQALHPAASRPPHASPPATPILPTEKLDRDPSLHPRKRDPQVATPHDTRCTPPSLPRCALRPSPRRRGGCSAAVAPLLPPSGA